MSKIDLHIHSAFSDDGEFTPEEIVAKCRAQKMNVISITDHNSVRGIAGALAAAEKEKGKPQVIEGVELDCTCGKRNFHVLGYRIDHRREEFAQIEQDIIRQEKAAAEEKIRLFEKATGIPLDAAEVFAASDDGVVTGELIAEIVLAKKNVKQYKILRPYLPGGEKSDMPNVRIYWDFFSEGKPAYVPIHYLSLHDAVQLIHSTGGIAILAHPGQNLTDEDSLLSSILSEKIDGIEAFSSYHRKETSRYYMQIAEKEKLFVTCGSDFHGKHKPSIKLGGHGALWEDSRLMAGIKEWIL